MRKILVILSLVSSCFNIAQAGTGPISCDGALCALPSGEGTQAQHRVYAGLVWQINKDQGLLPAMQLGFRALKTYSNNSVNGFDVSMLANVYNPLTLNSLRVVYVSGKSRETQGNLGIGYSFQQNAFLGTVALQAIHTRLGVDYFFNQNKLHPYLEGNTVTKNAPTLSCDDGGILMPAALINANAAAIKDQKSCVTLNPIG